jgi:DNA polymerase III epsilon subunit-like protein
MSQLLEFSSWFETKALVNLKQSIKKFNQLIDEQIQIHYMENTNKEIPSDYLKFQIESCINSFKINLLSDLEHTCLLNKFTFKTKVPIDKPIKLKTENTLMQRAKLNTATNALYSLPQLAFLDIETDGTNINTANILQIAIVKPIIDSEYNTLSYFTTWSKYVRPWKSYTQQDNKAFHINHIGDKELENAFEIDEAILYANYHLYNTVIVGYNINNFDIPILKRHCEEFKYTMNYKYSIDLYPAIWKNKKQTLEGAIKTYNVQTNPNPHDATADASCCIDLLTEIIERNELPNNEEDLLDLFNSSENIWQHYKKNKIIDINSDGEYSYLIYPTPASSLKRKLSEISIPSRSKNIKI